MLRLPPELHQAIFHHLNFKRAGSSSNRLSPMAANNPRFVPLASSVDMISGDFDTWEVNWPDWTDKEKEKFQCNPQTTREVLQSFSKGSTKELSVIKRRNRPGRYT
jgi:hypothetical protein